MLQDPQKYCEMNMMENVMQEEIIVCFYIIKTNTHNLLFISF